MDLVKEGLVAVQDFKRVLAEVADLDVGADGEVSGGRLDLACDSLEQGRFTRAVDADDGDFVEAPDDAVQTSEDGFLNTILSCVGLADVLELDDVIATARSGGPGKVDFLLRRWDLDTLLDVAIVSPSFGKDTMDEMQMLFKKAWRVDGRIEPYPLSVEEYEHGYSPITHEIRKYGIEVVS